MSLVFQNAESNGRLLLGLIVYNIVSFFLIFFLIRCDCIQFLAAHTIVNLLDLHIGMHFFLLKSLFLFSF